MNHGDHVEDPTNRRSGHGAHGGRGHWLMMFACCVPMIVIVGALYFRGAIGFGGVLAALLCVAVMPLMHGSMSHGDDGA